MNNHLQPEELSAYWDGEVSDEEKKRVEEHLRGCSTCSATLKSYQEVSSAVQGLPRKVFRGVLAYRHPPKSFYPLLAPITIAFLFLIGLSYYVGYSTGASHLFYVKEVPKADEQMKQAPPPMAPAPEPGIIRRQGGARFAEEAEPPSGKPPSPAGQKEEKPSIQPAEPEKAQDITRKEKGTPPPAGTPIPGFLPSVESVELCVSAPQEKTVILEFIAPEGEGGQRGSQLKVQASPASSATEGLRKEEKAKKEPYSRITLKLSPESLESLKTLLNQYWTVEVIQQGEETFLKLKPGEAHLQLKGEEKAFRETPQEVKPDEKK